MSTVEKMEDEINLLRIMLEIKRKEEDKISKLKAEMTGRLVPIKKKILTECSGDISNYDKLFHSYREYYSSYTRNIRIFRCFLLFLITLIVSVATIHVYFESVSAVAMGMIIAIMITTKLIRRYRRIKISSKRIVNYKEKLSDRRDLLEKKASLVQREEMGKEAFTRVLRDIVDFIASDADFKTISFKFYFSFPQNPNCNEKTDLKFSGGFTNQHKGSYHRTSFYFYSNEEFDWATESWIRLW